MDTNSRSNVAAPDPRLAKAQAQADAGLHAAAADTLEDAARDAATPAERARLLVLASQFVRAADVARARRLATEATEARPDAIVAWLALAHACDGLKAGGARSGTDPDTGRKAALRALELAATGQERVETARVLARFGEETRALQAMRDGWRESGRAPGLASFVLRAATQHADWTLAGEAVAVLRQAHAEGRTAQVAETPRTHLLWCADDAVNLRVVSHFAAIGFPARVPLSAPAISAKGRRLRVGYLSSDFRDHATAWLAMGLMRHHDRRRVELFGYCTSHDDGTAMRRDILGRFDLARSLSGMDDRAAADRIRADRLDVLVDLNGLTEGTRHGVLAWRPAPVQIGYLGFPGTSGGRFVDYVIGDRHTVPDASLPLYPERVIRLPHTYQINDYAARWLPPRASRADAGLPAGVPVLGMFNNVNKVGADVWRAWMDILRGAPGALLWMMDPGPLARGHLLAATRDAGIDPARLVFAPRLAQEAHLARLQCCDLVLDPWPYGGHTTTGDALFAGVPVLALEGTNFASRVSGGLLRAAGLGGMVQPDVARYVEAGIGLLARPLDLARMRRHLLENRSRMPVFDAQSRTRQLEAAYREVHERAARGLPARHLDVDAPAAPAAATAPAEPRQERAA